MKAKKATKGLLLLASLSLLASCNVPVNPGDDGDGGDTPVVPAEKQVVGLELNTEDVKKVYEIGEALDLTGLVVKAVYDDESKANVSGYTTNPANGTVFNEDGQKVITVSYKGKSAEFNVTVNPAKKTDWTDAEKAIFADHLYGIVLPFLDVEGATPAYDAALDEVYIEGLTFTGTEMADYAAKFLAADGWDDVTEDYGEDEGVFYSFERSTQTDAGMRRIAVKMYCVANNAYAAQGEFVLTANDPFSYTFPAAELAAEFEALELPAFALPEPTGDGLYFEFSANPYNAENLEYLDDYGYDMIAGYVYSNIYIYGFDQAGFEAYVDQFVAAGWAKEAGSGANDYDYYLTKELTDGIAHVETYFAGSFTVFKVEHLLEPLPVKEWPTTEVALLVSTVVPGSTTVIPSFASEDIEKFEVDYDYNELDVYGPETLKAEYVAILLAAGWTAGATDYYISPNGDVQIRLVYSSYYGLRIIVSAAPKWPTDVVAALVQAAVPGSTTVVPECPNGARYVKYGNNELDVYGDATLLEQYAAVLLAAGWTADEHATNTYISPAQDLSLELNYSTSYKCLEIVFAAYHAPAAEWPTTDVAALFPEGTQDVLPAFAGEATGFQIYNDSYGKGVTVFVGEENQDAAITAYEATLTTAGFTAVEGKDHTFKSPNAEYTVEVWKGTDGAINIEVSMIAYFPAAEVATKLAALVENVTDTLPALEGANSYAVVNGTGKFQIQCAYSTSAEVQAAQAAYIDALLAAGFTYAGVDSYGDAYYNSPNNQFNVCPWVGSTGLRIDVFPGAFVPPVQGWPAENVAAALKTLDANITDVLPACAVDGIYEVEAGSSGVEISINCGTTADAAAAVTAYQAVLLGAGFTEAGADNYGDMHYTSPNNQYDVCVWNYAQYLVIDIA